MSNEGRFGNKKIYLILLIVFICIIPLYLFYTHVKTGSKEYSIANLNSNINPSNWKVHDDNGRELSNPTFMDAAFTNEDATSSSSNTRIESFKVDDEPLQNDNVHAEAKSLEVKDNQPDGSYPFPFMRITMKDSFVVVEEPSYCLSIPITPSGKFVVVQQKRRAANRNLIEFPAGMIEDGKVWDCSLRELKEESGYSPPITTHCEEKLIPNKDLEMQEPSKPSKISKHMYDIDPWAIYQDREFACNKDVSYLGYVMSEPSRNRQRGYGFLVPIPEVAQAEPELDEEEIQYKKTKVLQLSMEELDRKIANGEMIAAGHIVFYERAKSILRASKM